MIEHRNTAAKGARVVEFPNAWGNLGKPKHGKDTTLSPAQVRGIATRKVRGGKRGKAKDEAR